jgi:hypothetical protein
LGFLLPAEEEADGIKSMKIRLAFLSATVLGIFLTLLGCSWNQATTEQDLQRVWSAPNVSVQERAAAVNRYFKKGTAIPAVVNVLGTNYSNFTPISTVWVGPGPEPRKTSGLIYFFGEDGVIVGTTAGIDENPLTGKFTFAGSSITFTNSVQMGTGRQSVGQ